MIELGNRVLAAKEDNPILQAVVDQVADLHSHLTTVQQAFLNYQGLEESIRRMPAPQSRTTAAIEAPAPGPGDEPQPFE